jgi:hypothetical protein
MENKLQGLKPPFIWGFDGWDKAQAYLRGNSKCDATANARTTTRTEADPYGMTNKKTKNNGKGNSVGMVLKFGEDHADAAYDVVGWGLVGG